jgi:hypothetical protein
LTSSGSTRVAGAFERSRCSLTAFGGRARGSRALGTWCEKTKHPFKIWLMSVSVCVDTNRTYPQRQFCGPFSDSTKVNIAVNIFPSAESFPPYTQEDSAEGGFIPANSFVGFVSRFEGKMRRRAVELSRLLHDGNGEFQFYFVLYFDGPSSDFYWCDPELGLLQNRSAPI